jgi:hypothetical protein
LFAAPSGPFRQTVPVLSSGAPESERGKKSPRKLTKATPSLEEKATGKSKPKTKAKPFLLAEKKTPAKPKAKKAPKSKK